MLPTRARLAATFRFVALLVAAATSIHAESFPDAETFDYRSTGATAVQLHVVKPTGWGADDQRPALIWFFGGGFVRGSTAQSIGWARRAAQLGMVGIAADYRVRERWPDADLRDVVADARLALRWAQDHAAALGIDPQRVVVGGSSAGGHLALWTSIPQTPPGLDPAEAPRFPPAALLLTNPPSDTSTTSGLDLRRFTGIDFDAFSPLQHLPAEMPPVFLIHGDADDVVPYRQSVILHRTLIDEGNDCEFVTVPGGTHRFSSDLAEWKQRLPALHDEFLRRHRILPINPTN